MILPLLTADNFQRVIATNARLPGLQRENLLIGRIQNSEICPKHANSSDIVGL